MSILMLIRVGPITKLIGAMELVRFLLGGAVRFDPRFLPAFYCCDHESKWP